MCRIVAEEDGEDIVGIVAIESLVEVAIYRERRLANILDTSDQYAVVATADPSALVVEYTPANFAHQLTERIAIGNATRLIKVPHIIGIVVVAHHAEHRDAR